MPTTHPVFGERLVRHGFAGRPARTVLDAAALVCGLQSQDVRAARFGVRARATGLAAADVDAAIEGREVLRAWLMRSTIHLVPAADLRWLVALYGPLIRRRNETARWPQLGLPPAVLAAAERAAPDILAGRTLTRGEFAAELAGRGVELVTTEARTHVLVYLSAIGLVCRAAERRGQSTFTLLDEWLPGSAPGPRGDDALAELARRYFTAFSPATAADFTAWSGLPSSRAVALIRDELTPVDLDGSAAYRLGEVEPARCLRLLAAYDNYLVGYKRRPFVPPERYGEVYIGGVIRPTVLLDGQVVGRWALKSRGQVEVEPFRTFSVAERRMLDAEVADVAAFSSADSSRARTPDHGAPVRPAAARAPAMRRPPR